MNRSSTTATIITALIGLVVTPIAVGLISQGGVAMYRIFSMNDAKPDLELLIPPMLTGLAGLILVAAVVVTGRWSSAGLLVAGALAILTLTLAIAPGLLLEFYRVVPEFVPREWTEGILYGLPMIVYTVLGAMGLTLILMRRRSVRSTTGLRIGGIIAVPVLLALGGWMMVWGSREGQLQVAKTFDTSPSLVVALAILSGAVLTIIGVGITLWSRRALILPAIALLVMSVFVLLSMTYPAMMKLIPGDAWITWLPHFLMGGAVAVAVAQLTFTIVIASLARRTTTFIRPQVGTWIAQDTEHPQHDHFPDAPPYAGGQPRG